MKYTLRIKDNNTFKYVFRNGTFSKGNYIIIHICKTKFNDENNLKNFFAVCVSKKNGNSVQRNNLKRLVREVYKEEESKLKLGNNIIIVYKKDVKAENINFNLIKEDIIKCFKDLDLYE